MNDGFDELGSSANPAIRISYEAALGRLILAHNEVDYRITTVIELAVGRLGGGRSLHKLAEGTFSERLANLALLKALPNELNFDGLDVDGIRDLNGKRNIVAHGHFGQNPYDGSYQLVRPRQYNRQQKWSESAFPAEYLDRLTQQLTSHAETLRLTELSYAFDKLEDDDSGS